VFQVVSVFDINISQGSVATRIFNVQSLTTSIGEPQVVDSTPVWYLLITKSRLTRPIIVTWCCYNSFCVLYVRSQETVKNTSIKKVLRLSAGHCPGAHSA